MGQYHMVYNKTKHEFFHPHKIDNGLKLLEQIGFMQSSSTALFLLVSNSNGRGGGDINRFVNPDAEDVIGRWAGDEIVVQGDYAEPSDPGYVDHRDDDELPLVEVYTDISDMVKLLLNELKVYE